MFLFSAGEFQGESKSSGVINCFVIHDKGDDYMVENVGLNMS